MKDHAQDVAEGSDDALLAAYGRGEAAAARLLTERLAPLAWRVAYRMLGDQAEAEDVAQEAMLRLWRMAPDWEPGRARVTTWLYRVTVNLSTDRLRRRRETTGDGELPEVADTAPGATERITEANRAAALARALEALPERQREAVVLRHLEGLANPEIAEIMGVGVEAVESLTARGKRRLTELLAGRREELGYDEG